MADRSAKNEERGAPELVGSAFLTGALLFVLALAGTILSASGVKAPVPVATWALAPGNLALDVLPEAVAELRSVLDEHTVTPGEARRERRRARREAREEGRELPLVGVDTQIQSELPRRMRWAADWLPADGNAALLLEMVLLILVSVAVWVLPVHGLRWLAYRARAEQDRAPA